MRRTMVLPAISFVAVLLSAAVALPPPPPPFSLHEQRTGTPRDYTRGARLDKSSVIPLRIALSQNGLDHAHTHLMDISDPSSVNYARYWTARDIVDTFSPLAETVDSVREWLVSSGISADRILHSSNKGWIGFDATVDEVEELLHAEYYEHKHSASDAVRVGCDG